MKESEKDIIFNYVRNIDDEEQLTEMFPAVVIDKQKCYVYKVYEDAFIKHSNNDDETIYIRLSFPNDSWDDLFAKRRTSRFELYRIDNSIYSAELLIDGEMQWNSNSYDDECNENNYFHCFCGWFSNYTYGFNLKLSPGLYGLRLKRENDNEQRPCLFCIEVTR